MVTATVHDLHAMHTVREVSRLLQIALPVVDSDRRLRRAVNISVSASVAALTRAVDLDALDLVTKHAVLQGPHPKARSVLLQTVAVSFGVQVVQLRDRHDSVSPTYALHGTRTDVGLTLPLFTYLDRKVVLPTLDDVHVQEDAFLVVIPTSAFAADLLHKELDSYRLVGRLTRDTEDARHVAVSRRTATFHPSVTGPHSIGIDQGHIPRRAAPPGTS